VPLGADVALEPLEPAQHLVHQAAHFGKLPRNRPHLVAHSVTQGGADLLGEALFELRGRDGERLETFPRAFEHRFEVCGLHPLFRRRSHPLHRPIDYFLVHRPRE
jgi:hypothetical protein